MAKILILGGGFGGVVAAEALAEQLSDDHQITLVSRSRQFLFYPALVTLAFGKCQADDVSFDLRKSMLARRVNFIEAEVARIDPDERLAILAHGEVSGSLSYDYLVVALGRRLATERVDGFFDHAHHLLTIDAATRFGEAARNFDEGEAVIGQCPGAKLPVPVYEAAFALARQIKGNGDGPNARITIVRPDSDLEFGDARLTEVLEGALQRHDIHLVSAFPIRTIMQDSLLTNDGQQLRFDLLMLLPPFVGPSAVSRLGLTSDDGYLNVDRTMKVLGTERIYAAGDCVNFDGPKLGHMAVHQATVAAANLAAEIDGHEPVSHYQHDLKIVIEASDGEGIYFHKDLWMNEPSTVRHGRFWSWAKHIHGKYFGITHK